MALPGLPKKVNIQTSTLRSTAAAAVSVSTRSTAASSARRSTGVMFGVGAARTARGKGLIFNPRAYNAPHLAELRYNLNAGRTPSYMYNLGMPQQCNCETDDTMNYIMGGMMALKALGEITAQITDAVQTSKANKASSNSSTKGKNTFEGYDYNKFNLSSFTRLNGLKDAKSLKGINEIETKAKDDLAGFNQNYSREVQTNVFALNESLAKLNGAFELANVTINTSSLEAKPLNIDVNDLTSIDKGVETIDQDIAEVDKFITETLYNASSKLGETSTSLGAQIGRLEAQLNGLEEGTEEYNTVKTQIGELREKQQKVNNAKTALNSTIKQQAEAIKTTLTEKKNALGDIKLTLSQVADKKYEVAKDNDEKLVDFVNKQIRLERKISALNDKITSETDETKRGEYQSELSELNTELAGVYKEMIELVKNLQTDDNQTTFTNSKGKTYTLKNKSYVTDANTIQSWQNFVNNIEAMQNNAKPIGSLGALPAIDRSIGELGTPSSIPRLNNIMYKGETLVYSKASGGYVGVHGTFLPVSQIQDAAN